MKKSELQQIIKEEIKRAVKENMQKAVQPDFESYYAAKRAGKILPGYYNAVESNYGGTYDIPQFTIRFTQEMTFEDAYKQLNNKGYKSPWGRLDIDLLAANKIPKEPKFTLPDTQLSLF